jgi:hypothetical protein
LGFAVAERSVIGAQRFRRLEGSKVLPNWPVLVDSGRLVRAITFLS